MERSKLIDRLLNPLEKRLAARIQQPIIDGIPEAVKSALAEPTGPEALIKSSIDTLAYQVPGAGVRRYQFDYSNQDMNLRRKPQSGLSFQLLRQFSVTHEVTRICINARKRQITQLDWDIVPVDADDKTSYPEKDMLIEFFKNLGGYKVRFRSVMDQIIEDLMALDAVALYRIRNKGGAPLYYIPLDAATIKLRLDEMGNTPEPPEIAYKQIVRGQIVAELTTDDLIYDMMNARSASPYGLAPLESLIIIVSSALKSNLYNLNYLTDGNIPEGIIQLPESWSATQIKEYQEVWDAYLGGDARATSKIRFVPAGNGYTPTKKREDMAFNEFNLWLMKVTCSMFDVQPQEIGFVEGQATRANAAEQGYIQTRRGMLPLVNFLQELFTDIIQHDLGIEHLKFSYLGIEDKDDVQESQAIQGRIFSGVTTVDEERKQLGYDPLGIDRPFVVGAGATLLDTLLAGPQVAPGNPNDGVNAAGTDTAGVQHNDDGSSSQKSPNDLGQNTTQNAKPEGTSNITGNRSTEAAGHGDMSNNPNAKSADPVLQVADELRKFRVYAVKRAKEGKQIRPFESTVLPKATVDDMNAKLANYQSVEDVRKVISEQMQDHQVRFIADLTKLRSELAKVLA